MNAVGQAMDVQATLLELSAQHLQFFAARDQAARREAGDLVLACRHRQLEVFVERPDLVFVPRHRVRQPLFLVAQRLEPGPFLVQLDFRLAHALLQQERPLLQRFHDPVGVGFHQRCDSFEQFDRHGRSSLTSCCRHGVHRPMPPWPLC